MKMTKIALAAALAMGAASAYAGPFYVEAGVTQANADLGDTSGWTSVDDTDNAYSIGLGYKFSDSLSVEGGYIDLGKASISTSGSFTTVYYGYTLSGSGAASATAEADGYYFGPRLSMSVTKDIEAFARAGMLFWNLDQTATASGSFTYRGTAYSAAASATASDDGSDPYVGVGASYKFNDNMAAAIDWTRYTVLDSDIDVWSAKIRYSF